MDNKHPIPLTPQDAWQLIQTDRRAILVDIRSTMEYLFLSKDSGQWLG